METMACCDALGLKSFFFLGKKFTVPIIMNSIIILRCLKSYRSKQYIASGAKRNYGQE